jgi:transcriptional regulator GlxA family with amidase domain
VRISGRELADRAVPVDEIGGHGGIALHDLLASESDPQHVLEHLVAFVAALACASDPIDARVRGFTALSRRPRARLDALARELSVPDRTLRACLLNEVGLSPKRFLRIQRVLRAANLILHHRASAVEVAELTGFCDQPHMLREFGSLLGEAPRKFVARGQAD